MPISELYSGSAAISRIEWSLTKDSVGPDVDTTSGVFQFFLDISDMNMVDILKIRVYEKVRSGDAQRIVYQAILNGQQIQPIWVSPSLILMHGWDVTLYCNPGTVTVNWSIRQVA